MYCTRCCCVLAVVTVAWNSRHYTTAVVSPVERYQRAISRQLPQRPRTSLDAGTSRDTDVVHGTHADRHCSHSTAQSSHNAWQSFQNICQSSLPRVFASKTDKRSRDTGAETRTNQSRRRGQSRADRQLPGRSSSALDFTESAGNDIELKELPVYRPVAQKATVSTPVVEVRSPRTCEPLQRWPDDLSSSPRSTFSSKFGKMFRRSRSDSSSRDTSPVRSPSPNKHGKDSKDRNDTKDSKDVRDNKDVKTRRNLWLKHRRRYEEITTGEMLSVSTGQCVQSTSSSESVSQQHVYPQLSTAQSSFKPSSRNSSTSTTCCSEPSSAPIISSEHSTPSTPVKTAQVSSPSLALDGDVTLGTPTTGRGSEKIDRGGLYTKKKHQVRPRLKLPSRPMDDTLVDSTPHQLKIQLTVTEQEIVAKQYNDNTTAVTQAIADIDQLMTSSHHVTTPTSGSDSMSASDSDLLSCSPGSKSSSTMSSLDSACDEVHANERLLVDGRTSFRRSELVPTVRRFIVICQQLTSAATDPQRSTDFHRHLTDSVHAFVTILSVSRRATYRPRELSQLFEALRQVSHCYCELLMAADCAVTRATDHPSVIDASKKAASLAQRLSSLLITVKHLKSTRTDSHTAFF